MASPPRRRSVRGGDLSLCPTASALDPRSRCPGDLPAGERPWWGSRSSMMAVFAGYRTGRGDLSPSLGALLGLLDPAIAWAEEAGGRAPSVAPACWGRWTRLNLFPCPGGLVRSLHRRGVLDPAEDPLGSSRRRASVRREGAGCWLTHIEPLPSSSGCWPGCPAGGGSWPGGSAALGAGWIGPVAAGVRCSSSSRAGVLTFDAVILIPIRSPVVGPSVGHLFLALGSVGDVGIRATGLVTLSCCRPLSPSWPCREPVLYLEERTWMALPAGLLGWAGTCSRSPPLAPACPWRRRSWFGG